MKEFLKRVNSTRTPNTQHMTVRVLVQGWYYLTHSYSIVLQNQLRHWIENRDKTGLVLKFDKLPYYSPEWKDSQTAKESGPLSMHSKFISDNMWDGEPVDIVYRIGFPYDVSPPPYVHTKLLLFITCEFGKLDPSTFIGGFGALDQAIGHGHLHFVTPSEWSAKALSNHTTPIERSRIHIIPHGIDPQIFKPLPVSNRSILSTLVQDTLKPFVFLHVGAMTSNKGILFIIKSFLKIAKNHPEAYLMLKGHRNLYKSNRFLDAVMEQIGESGLANKRIMYTEDEITTEQLVQLYNVADCYVSPYMAEGFNIPALEAMACGVPVIATANGPTDEFLDPGCTIKLRSRVVSNDQGNILVYDPEELEKAMEHAITNPRLQKVALTLGSPRIHKSHAWKKVSEQHVKLFKEIQSIKEKVEPSEEA